MVFVWSNLVGGEPHFTLSQVAFNDSIMVFALCADCCAAAWPFLDRAMGRDTLTRCVASTLTADGLGSTIQCGQPATNTGRRRRRVSEGPHREPARSGGLGHAVRSVRSLGEIAAHRGMLASPLELPAPYCYRPDTLIARCGGNAGLRSVPPS